MQPPTTLASTRQRLRPTVPSSLTEETSLWTEKYRPKTVKELEIAIHKKKVAEVRDWLASSHQLNCRVVVLTGPPGCGKSITLEVVSAELGFRTVEWIPQALPVFSEDKANHSSYRSKLDHFMEFVRGLVAPPLATFSADSKDREVCNEKSRPAIAIIDDLPLAYGQEQLSRLRRILGSLVSLAAIPTAVLLTPDQHDFVYTLQCAGATIITFNPITELKICKVLNGILAKEGITGLSGLDPESLTLLAKQANGDLGNAISTLQFYSSTGRKAGNNKRGNRIRSAKRPRRCAEKSSDPVPPSVVRRDLSLTTLHGLGKLLYNKRKPMESGDEKEVNSMLAPWTARPPMDGFIPESVLDAAGLNSNAVSAFLHENVPFFVDDAAILDLAGCLAQLSAADVLVTGRAWRGGNDTSLVYADENDGGEVPPLAEACSAITAARGVCFWNSHPAPRSFKGLHAPSVFEARRGMVKNSTTLRTRMRMVRVLQGRAESMESLTVLSTEILPVLGQLCSQAASGNWLHRQQPRVWWRWWDGKVHEVNLMGDLGGEDLEMRDVGESSILPDAGFIDDDPIEEV